MVLNNRFAFDELDDVIKGKEVKKAQAKSAAQAEATQRFTIRDGSTISKTLYVGKNQTTVMNFYNSRRKIMRLDIEKKKRSGIDKAIQALGLEDSLKVYQENDVIYIKKKGKA